MILISVSIFTFLLTFCYVTVVLFFRRGWMKLRYFNRQERSFGTKVSVLIAARNEEGKIELTLADLINQNYPKDLLEIIVVDDHSTDRTAEIVSSFRSQGITLIRLNESEKLNSYKKKAITEAINLATGKLIVTTDADCKMDKQWLSTIVSFYETNNYKLISSPVSYFQEKSLFETLQTLEFLYLIGLGASSIGNKIPSTCNGANLAYEREVFFELKGFQGIDDLASGDDELFLHKVATRYPKGIGFCKSRDAVVYTHAKASLLEFIRQRKRWASKSTRYKNKSIVVLGVSIWLFNVSLFLNFVLGFYNHEYFRLFFFSITFKLLVEVFFLVPMCRFVKRDNLIFYMPFLTIIHIGYMIYIGVAGNSGKYMWKGREVR